MLLYQTLKNKLTGCFAQVRRNTYGEYVVKLMYVNVFGVIKCISPDATCFETDLASACDTANAMVFDCIVV